MRFGCHLPMFGPVATRDSLLGFARRMEALGYDSLWASDHVIVPHRIESRDPYRRHARDLDDMRGIVETFAREVHPVV
jgi:hypothetical protein